MTQCHLMFISDCGILLGQKVGPWQTCGWLCQFACLHPRRYTHSWTIGAPHSSCSLQIIIKVRLYLCVCASVRNVFAAPTAAVPLFGFMPTILLCFNSCQLTNNYSRCCGHCSVCAYRSQRLGLFCFGFGALSAICIMYIWWWWYGWMQACMVGCHATCVKLCSVWVMDYGAWRSEQWPVDLLLVID